jgi:hypothetical protein
MNRKSLTLLPVMAVGVGVSACGADNEEAATAKDEVSSAPVK